MIDDYLVQHAHDRIETMQREADLYRKIVDRAPLAFGPALHVRARRRIARWLVTAAQRVAPDGTVALATYDC